ncbi:hypothetical protein SEUBUCD646_0B06220 [Saccharomyces eubayanus]|uniref:HLR1-like protein n=1 Tax=Saccharomyces eubayanus TaxID=1080349 RepID=A0ABN8VW43_SACEU|nr:hypothetical protein SEUBUCD650_0B06220 [Saccharomyces eubayanus]CAI1899950.1 hypothetical protein SEUBUCD646_0B06220 [Saccharomyces eubayanus]
MENLLPPPPPQSKEFSTPPRNRHRHKRSFAISGDFEFLKQLTPAPALSSAYDSPTFEDLSTITNSTKLTVPNESALICSPSPRFFINGESTYTSPIKGVPDAIINLDDVFTDDPKMFKSHRKTKSVPVKLDDFYSFHKGSSVPELTINEEMDEDEINSQLLGPIKPSSTSLSTCMDKNKTRPLENAKSYNSLKIQAQKQRYYYSTRYLPLSSDERPTDSQTLTKQSSITSLFSSRSITPVSCNINTAGRINAINGNHLDDVLYDLDTPASTLIQGVDNLQITSTERIRSTPQSSSMKNCFPEDGKYINGFNFQSQNYDIASLTEDFDPITSLSSSILDSERQSVDEEESIPEEILLGEPLHVYNEISKSGEEVIFPTKQESVSTDRNSELSPSQYEKISFRRRGRFKIFAKLFFAKK